MVGMVRLQSKLAPVRTARGWCACVKDSNFGNFCPIDMKLVSFERALRRHAQSGAVCCIEAIIFEDIVSRVVQ